MGRSNSDIDTTTCNEKENQKWIISLNQDNSWTITNKVDLTQVWEVSRGQTRDGANIAATWKDGSDKQKWDIFIVEGNKYKITSRFNNKCATLTWDYVLTNNECKDNNIDQTWTFEKMPDDDVTIGIFDPSIWYRFKNGEGNTCAYLDFKTKVLHGNCVKKDSNNWAISQNPDGSFSITNKADITKAWSIDGTVWGGSIQANPKNDSINQTWIIMKVDANKYLIKSKVTNRCARPVNTISVGEVACSGQRIDTWVIEKWQ